MSPKYFYDIAVIAPIPATLLFIADHGDENIVAIDVRGILTLSNREISPKYSTGGINLKSFSYLPRVFLCDSPDWTYFCKIILYCCIIYR